MVRILNNTIVECDEDTRIDYRELAGLSTDNKPITNLATGSSFIEVDTGNVYFFDEVGHTWHKVGDSNG